MTHTTESNRLNRLWTAMIEASAAMVAIRYAAPWNGQRTSRSTDDDTGCNA